MAYSKKVVDKFENTINEPAKYNVGRFDPKEMNVGTGMVGAPACGDVMKLQIEVDENGVIVDTKFKTFGCGSAIASSSVATEWIKGKTVDEAAWGFLIAGAIFFPVAIVHGVGIWFGFW